MDFKEKLAWVSTLKAERKTLENVIDQLALEKTHHIEAVHMIMVAFDLSRTEADSALYAHDSYKSKEGEINPFTQDFLDALE